VGDVPGEAPVEEVARDHWVKEDSERGEKSLERWPEEEVYCLVKDGKRWSFPSTTVERGEGLDEAVKRGLVGVEGKLGGQGMDSWLVTRKPVGLLKDGEARVSPIHSRRPCQPSRAVCLVTHCPVLRSMRTLADDTYRPSSSDPTSSPGNHQYPKPLDGAPTRG
jgi:hypothetical protein